MTKEKGLLPVEAPAAEEPPFELGHWGAHPCWRCKFCAWDTLDGEEAALQHYRDRHAPPMETAPEPVILVSDRYGNPVNKEA